MNIENTAAFIIDSPLIAFMVSLIANGKEINVVYEIKDGIDNKLISEYIYDLLLEGTIITNKDVIIVPSPFFLLNPKKRILSAFKIILFQLKMTFKSRHLRYSKYLGPLTSSIIKSKPSINCVTLDHGVSEYYARMSKNSKIKKSTKNILKIALLLKIHALDETPSKIGFTLCKLKNDSYIHLDYMKYSTDNKISQLLRYCLFHLNIKNPTLVFPINKWHSEEGFAEDIGNFDFVNIDLIVRNCDKSEHILLKYHPTVYITGGPSRSLSAKLEELGYKVTIFDDMLTDEFLKGRLPAEIAINIFNINKIIGENSATFYNVSHNKTINKISCCNFSDNLLDKKSINLNLISTLNQHIINPINFSK